MIVFDIKTGIMKCKIFSVCEVCVMHYQYLYDCHHYLKLMISRNNIPNDQTKCKSEMQKFAAENITNKYKL